MKTFKLILIIVHFFLFSNRLFASNPANYDYTNNMANKMIIRLDKDVHLTDSQKIVIQKRAFKYELQMKTVKTQTNKKSKDAIKNEFVMSYKSMLDSLLTPEQKDTLMSKKIKRFELSNFKI